MQLTKKTSIIIGLILSVIIGYGVFYVLMSLYELLAALKPEVLAAIISAVVTAFAGIAAVMIGQRQSKQRDIDESHRSKKVEIYKGFLDAVSGIMAKGNENVTKNGLSDQELIDYLVEFKTDIILWGDPNVIKRHLEFEVAASQDTSKIFIAVDNLYKSIREDIGLSNKKLNNYELVRMYLKDPTELDEIIASNKD